MEYEIKIVIYGENKDYDKQLESYKSRDRYRDCTSVDGGGYPEKMIAVKCLETRLDQEQFEAVRKAVLEVM